MDGTLFPGVLGMEFVAALAARDLSDPQHIKEIKLATRRYEDGELDLASATAIVYERYAACLKGQAQHQVQEVAWECWARVSRQLFSFSRRLVEDLAELGIPSMLISGSPDEVIQAAARDLRIPYARGAIASTHAGRYTGELASAPGVRGGKSAVLAELTCSTGVAPKCVFALGNSINDAEVFRRSALSVAFEPDGELMALSEANGWLIADRTSLPTMLRKVLASLAEYRGPLESSGTDVHSP
ncbi:HAD family hydrolase [Saccharopolyspora pogona]|uniref:HAD family hydrolase n=1 Tax=Saccharopolyspora pogona TaxID=333966 RepID=UPI001684AC52|nr:haloacid dehalogenase-like hydrolase [Saccharopolyspora pogona]